MKVPRHRYDPLWWGVAAVATFLLVRLVCNVLDALPVLLEWK
jgi:hypothetical protein